MTIRMPLLALCACAPSLDPSGAAPADPVREPTLPMAMLPPPGQPLVLTAEDPHPGGEVHLAVSNANPGEMVRWWSSVGGLGVGPCYAALGGLCLELGAGTQLLGATPADAAGVAEMVAPIPLTALVGGRLTFQAAARRGAAGATSVKSNAVVTTIGDPSFAHTIAVDGSLADWTADELFSTTSADGTVAGVSWDATHVYVAFQHPDVASGGGLHWQVLWLGDGTAGSSSPPGLGSQAPSLPFAATVVVRRKADGSYDDLQLWDDALQTWVGTASFLGTLGSSVAESGDVLELAIPRGALGDSVIEVALASAYEGGGYESTYAGVPADAFADGYDPDPLTFLRLDLSLPESPVAQNP